MSLAQRFERRLESVVGGAFARVFKGQVEPVEIGTALQREATDKRSVVSHGQVMSPNRYRVTLAPSDYERLEPWEAQLTNSLAELVQEHLDENGWATVGDIEVYLARDESLHTGVFGVASRMDPKAPPRQRPFDSLSLPIVPGRAPGDYADLPSQRGAPQGRPTVGAGDFGGAGYADGGYPDRGHGGGYPASFVPPAAYQPPAVPPAPAVPDGPPRWPSTYGQQPPASHYEPPGAPGGPAGYAPPGPQYPPQDYRGGHARSGAALVVEHTERRLDLRVGSNLVGRGSDADLQVPDQGVSRRHLDIQYDGRTATAYDLGSTNGTAINGHLVSSQLLRHGDVIRIGHSTLVFVQEPA